MHPLAQSVSRSVGNYVPRLHQLAGLAVVLIGSMFCLLTGSRLLFGVMMVLNSCC